MLTRKSDIMSTNATDLLWKRLEDQLENWISNISH